MFFKNENDFKCLVTSQKNFGKYFKVFGCVSENPLENTFSLLPNKYFNRKFEYINQINSKT